ncbi:MAG: creatininase family protein [Ignavibacteria bacterium]|nr:MAG: creatininase family protein [Ignavibacteria bacterium]
MQNYPRRMVMKPATIFLMLSLVLKAPAAGQNLPSRWDELVASDWPLALAKSESTCILPIGILEKHGPHAAIGCDMIHVREWAARVTAKEYAVVFPDYFYGQIYEAKHQPGAFALPSRLVWDLLDATCEEIARNGLKKILIVNGHGGNPHLLRYFVQSQLERRRDYVVYLYDPPLDTAFYKKAVKMWKSDPNGDMHAGESETSTLLYLRPDLVKLDRARQESGANLNRLSLPDLYTGIWWYADFPNHYAGEGEKATKELGELLTEHSITSLLRALRVVKADRKTKQLQNEFFDRVLK